MCFRSFLHVCHEIAVNVDSSLWTLLKYFKVDNHVIKIQLLRTSIRAEPESKSAISFLKLNEIS